MYASKENARKAEQIVGKAIDGTTVTHLEWQFLAEFMGKVVSRLPSEASYKADADRRERQRVPTKPMKRPKAGASLR